MRYDVLNLILGWTLLALLLPSLCGLVTTWLDSWQLALPSVPSRHAHQRWIRCASRRSPARILPSGCVI